MGSKRQPSYRIVAIEKEVQRDGSFHEILGYYNPRTQPATITLQEDRIYAWMSKGAQPSDSVLQIFKSAGLMDRYARFKQGEALDVLLAEEKAAEATRNINPKTTRVVGAK
jgi:small subunit ribosomal protein S16